MIDDLSASEAVTIADEDDAKIDAPDAPEQQDAADSDDSPDTPAAADAEDDSTTALDAAKPKSRAQERIGQLVSERNQYRADAEQAARRLERLQSSLQLPSNFDDLDYEVQQQVLLKRTVNETRLDDVAYEVDTANQRAAAAQAAAFNAKSETAKARLPDFDVVVSNPNLEITSAMAELIVESDRAPEVAYYLGKNPAEAARIASLPLHRQGAAISAIERKVSAPSNARKASTAPPPVKTVGGGASTATKDPADMTMAEFQKYHDQQEAKRTR